MANMSAKYNCGLSGYNIFNFVIAQYEWETPYRFQAWSIPRFWYYVGDVGTDYDELWLKGTPHQWNLKIH